MQNNDNIYYIFRFQHLFLDATYILRSVTLDFRKGSIYQTLRIDKITNM